MFAINKKERIESLQGLRVLAFVGIFLSHAIDTPTGAWGVSVFIMLSGFLMTYSYWDRNIGKLSIKDSVLFSINKIKTLYPLHIIMLIVALLPYYLIPLFQDYSSNEMLKLLFKIVITVPLIQAWFPAGFEAINTVAWYLSAMLFLYAVFPRILWRLKRYKESNKVIVFMILTYFAQFAFAFISRKVPLLSNAHWSCYILPLFRLGDFFIGCCLGYCFIKRKNNKTKTSYATIVETIFIAMAVGGMVCQAYLTDSQWFTYTLVYIPSSAGIVYSLARKEGLISRLLSMKCFQIMAVITPFAFLIHRQVIHYVEDGYKLATKTLMNPCLLIVLSMIITVVFSVLYMKVSLKKREGII